MCESHSPGATVAPRTSTSTSAGPSAPIARITPSSTRMLEASRTGAARSPLRTVPTFRNSTAVIAAPASSCSALIAPWLPSRGPPPIRVACELPVDVAADPAHGIRRVVALVAALIVDAWDRGNPVVLEKVRRLAVERGDTDHVRVVEHGEATLVYELHPLACLAQLDLVVGEIVVNVWEVHDRKVFLAGVVDEDLVPMLSAPTPVNDSCA